ncbi:FecR family protein [Pedobacter sp. GR22-6]|uniref:FecR family protein n=1 Tax=Pedobacter sp. GR22-6 TaxID=3127957 RepID=UPI00307E6B72
MKDEEVKELLDKYFAGTCTPGEKVLVERAYNLQDSKNGGAIDEARLEALKAEVWNRLEFGAAWDHNAASELDVTPVKAARSLWPRIRIAVSIAAAVATIVFGVWFFTTPRHLDNDRHPELVSGSDIAPGKNGATITLANGAVIALDGNKKGVIVGDELKYDDGEILKPVQDDDRLSSKAQNLTASTAKGQTYEFTLPDGTHVFLNADSKISFPSQFSGKERKIFLEGEAYFVVTHDEKQPFRVESKGQVVEDIGTEFNINAYRNELSVKTTLVEGSARVIPDKAAQSVVLKPNQQSVLTGAQRIAITEANITEATAWKDGYFRFYDENIENIMKQLARWYNIEVSYEGKVTTEGFTGRVSRSKNISQALMMLEKTKGVHFRIEGRRVTVIN